VIAADPVPMNAIAGTFDPVWSGNAHAAASGPQDRRRMIEGAR
jgi:hypothetical protein